MGEVVLCKEKVEVKVIIIEIDGYKGQVFLEGASYTKAQLDMMYTKAKRIATYNEALALYFCQHYAFRLVDEVSHIDFRIDTDTSLIYAPHY